MSQQPRIAPRGSYLVPCLATRSWVPGFQILQWWQCDCSITSIVVVEFYIHWFNLMSTLKMMVSGSYIAAGQKKQRARNQTDLYHLWRWYPPLQRWSQSWDVLCIEYLFIIYLAHTIWLYVYYIYRYIRLYTYVYTYKYICIYILYTLTSSLF